ncbi:E3 ubiquitin-protein ligase RNF123 [Thecamonas trahens ATCC 50062]|uniref:E3 ubiquitin-protein ligase RNF123 n=1 Tax=Thecamonas trahens ATCC 50062 TaxID=461836 RepID=A0A0L0D4X1_THETB|nr:E3 ubiquitin-protein ligase RNF123 [Thecamonas trahens ATCC 50062]KNC46353.1 E3 ubiquitin-protein ligase RNF123 [Thecamonas trahens ATCC 50062]|eukprot:XP_013760646.1 E3 ubiquitin-protein ligase RNF123 [Thecamonas trahens ATCC 50062]
MAAATEADEHAFQLDRFLRYTFRLPLATAPDRLSLANLSAHLGARLAAADSADEDDLDDVFEYARMGMPDPGASAPSSSSTSSSKPNASQSDAAAALAAAAAATESHAHTLGGLHVPGLDLQTLARDGAVLVDRICPRRDEARGKLGGSIAGLMVTLGDTSCKLEEVLGGFRIESAINFASVVGTTAVFASKWMYEVVLETEGVMQIGWATMGCKFTTEEGVGDSPDSYAYDGSRVRKWNCASYEYGERWKAGDVIGVAIDLDDGTISFYRNGLDLGVAFTDVAFAAPGMAYFPSVSLSRHERVWVNLGASPFRFAVPGYAPLSQPPPPLATAQSAYLCGALKRAVPYFASGNLASPLSAASADNSATFAAIEQMVVGTRIFQSLVPLLASPYLVGSHFLPLLLYLNSRPERNLIASLVACMERVCESHELTAIAGRVMERLGHLAASTAISPRCSSGPLVIVRLANALVAQPAWRRSWLQTQSFSNSLEFLFALKHPSEEELAVLLPHVWWERAGSHLSNAGFDASAVFSAEKHASAVAELGGALGSIERAQHALLSLLLEVEPEATTSWLAELVYRNRGVSRNLKPMGLSMRSALINIFFALADIVFPDGPQSAAAAAASFPLHYFVRDDANDAHGMIVPDVDRVSGMISHLRKAVPAPDDECDADVAASLGIRSALLLDALVLLYVDGLALQAKASLIETQELRQALLDLDDKLALRLARSLGASPSRLFHAIEAAARKVSWSSLVVHTKAKSVAIFAFHHFLASLLERASPAAIAVAHNAAAAKDDEPGSGWPPPSWELAYLPALYLDAAVDAFHLLRRAIEPYPLVETGHQCLVFLQWTVAHFSDRRIHNPDLRDLLLQSLSLLLQYEEFVELLESDLFTASYLVPRLLAAYDDRFWVTVTITTMLLRIFKGTGFGSRALRKRGKRSTPRYRLPDPQANVASPLFQAAFVASYLNAPDLLSLFVNTAFNSLNWSLTELSVALDQHLALRAAGELHSSTRKLGVMFALAVNLLRVLEFTASYLPQLFAEEACGEVAPPAGLAPPEVNMMRMIEVVAVVLAQYTTGPDARLFADVQMQLERPGAEPIMPQTDMLKAVAGILVALDRPMVAAGNTRGVVDALLLSASFEVGSLEFVTDALAAAPDVDALADLTSRVTAAAGSRSQLLAGASVSRSPSGDVCTICYASLINATFEPCKHRACYGCMTRQLLNVHRCFFCNADVATVVRDGSASTPQDTEVVVLAHSASSEIL